MDSFTIPRSVMTLRSRVRKLYLSWWTTHYAVGLFGVLAGTLLTALTSAAEPASMGDAHFLSVSHLKAYSWLIGIVAAVCTSLVTFLGPIGKAERYWSAYHALDQACLEYQEGLLSRKRFVALVRHARTILQAGGVSDEQMNDAMRDVEHEVARRPRPRDDERPQATPGAPRGHEPEPAMHDGHPGPLAPAT